jgi:hypothetical protein
MNGNDFFRPLWLRVAIVAACAGWAILEWGNGESGWAMMAAAVTAYGIWSFIINFEPSKPEPPKSGSDER